ncbi:hypothetical protein [Alicyclobacillus mengziensis]|uniref:Uncharacterized protein n=1 Tax=Alicyclobacillus mengziensis TaxID=2931921 RepID=A0A9X7W147_9BACL|nr:hypothetical protein [Alicyclobacillus mengziensis]QSO48460.1 hypothetical protein JZ786_05580 [Alicyclobacillus mengziensis]
MSEHYPLRGHFPPRYVYETVKEAEQLPSRYINLINEKRYDEALSLLSPQLRRAYSGPAGEQALHNIQHMRLIKLVDITPIKPVVRYLPRHYAIKTYGAIIDTQVYDPKPFATCPGAIGIQVNKFEVIKYTPESPWFIDGQSGVPPATAKRWGLDIGKNDFDFCRRYSEGSQGNRADGTEVNVG